MGSVLCTSAIDGLLIGVIYGLAAMGLTLIFGVMDVINLAHGPLIALGMFGVYLLFTFLGLNPFLAVIIVAALGLLLGVIIYFIAVNRVIDAPPLSSLLSTFSVNMIIIGIGTAILSTASYNVDYSMGTMNLGIYKAPGARIAACIFDPFPSSMLAFQVLQTPIIMLFG